VNDMKSRVTGALLYPHYIQPSVFSFALTGMANKGKHKLN